MAKTRRGHWLRGKGMQAKWLSDRRYFVGSECLLWPFHRNEKGYGTVGYCGKVVRAHRLMCEFVHGPPPTPKHHAAHDCGNGHLGCVHPLHLSWKTEKENKQDNIRHGTAPGNKWGQRGKFTPEKIREIRQLAATTPKLHLAKQFNVSPSALRDILKGKTYRHVA